MNWELNFKLAGYSARAQSYAEDGAFPMLYVATSSIAESGGYSGLSGVRRCSPKRVESSEASHDEESAKRLWEVSSELTGVRFNI